MQRFVKLLRLKNTPESIAEYRRVHREIWPEIVEGIRAVGISTMEIYLLGNLAVMIMELSDSIDVDEAMSKLAQLPRQAEWEAFVSKYQECNPGDTSAEKWKPMELAFTLPHIPA